jgi:hypothetical protein
MVAWSDVLLASPALNFYIRKVMSGIEVATNALCSISGMPVCLMLLHDNARVAPFTDGTSALPARGDNEYILRGHERFTGQEIP